MRGKAIPPALPPDLWAWRLDLRRNRLIHTNGLQVQFLRADARGDWHPVPITPLPAALAVANLSHYVGAAAQLFAAGLARTNACLRAGRRDYCRGNERRKFR